MADTTPTLREAAQQALEALEHMTGVLNAASWATGHADAAVKALRAALAEQAAEQAEPKGVWRCVGADDSMRRPEECDLVGGETDMPAAPAAEQAEPVAVPAGYALVKVRDEEHRRQLIADAMFPPAPAPAEQAEPVASDRERFEAAWNGCWRHLGSSLVASAKELAWSTWQAGAAPPAPARQPAPALTVGMLMEAGLMVGSTPDSVGTSNWAVRMLGALRALAVDQPDAPPAPAPTWPEWAEQILKIVREYSGYDGYDDADGVDLPEEVREALEELTAQITRLEAKAPAPARQEWQPIETAPMDGTNMLLWWEGRVVLGYWNKHTKPSPYPRSGWCGVGAWAGGDMWTRPTHWMPLPAAPLTAAPAEGGAA